MIEIPKTAIFPKTTKKETVVTLYDKSLSDIAEREHDVYLSCALSSGGARRNFKLTEENGLIKDQITRIIYQNMGFVDMLVPSLHDNLSQGRLVVPHHLGQVPGFDQIDYNAFYILHMAGIDMASAERFFDRVMTGAVCDLAVFNHEQATRTDRWQEYRKLLDGYETVVSQADVVRPVTQVLLAPDSRLSLGSSLERAAGEILEASIADVILDKNHSDFDKIASHSPWVLCGAEEVTRHLVSGTGDTLTSLKACQ